MIMMFINIIISSSSSISISSRSSSSSSGGSIIIVVVVDVVVVIVVVVGSSRSSSSSSSDFRSMFMFNVLMSLFTAMQYQKKRRDLNPKDNSLIRKDSETSTYKGPHSTFAALLSY